MKRVFYIECSGPVWRDIAIQCRDTAQWAPVLWTASHSDATDVARHFPEACFLPNTDAALGLSARPRAWPAAALDAALLEALSFDESITLHMMDRMDPACGAGFTHDDRRRHYHALLRYWIAAFDALQPDLIVFSIAPHVVFDYVVLALARQRGIPTLMFERIGLPGWVFPLADFSAGSAPLRRRLAERPAATIEHVPLAFQNWFKASTQGDAAMPANYQKKLERYKLGSPSQLPSLSRAIMHELKRAIVLWRRNGLQPAQNSYLRSRHFPHGRCGPGETLIARIRGVFAKRRLMRCYDGLAGAAIEGDNYVLLALHYQPERATVPMGGAFGDQTLIADLLAKSLPDGWKLYIKEHPWQLQSFGRGEVQRTEAFYTSISAHENVVLLPREVSTATMVRGARAVATVTGSVGWDALCSGIPVLLFGAAWYKDCGGAHRIGGQADLHAAMTAIAAGERPQQPQVAAFCAALAQVCVPGTLEPQLESIGDLTVEAAAATMSAALIRLQSDSMA